MRLPLLTLWRSLGRAAPAYSPRKAFQSQYDRAKEYNGRAASPVPRVPASPVTPSRSPQINAQTRSEPTKAYNRTGTTRTHEQRSRPGGIGTQAIASRPVCRHAANSRREPRQSAATERHRRTRPSPAPQFRIPNFFPPCRPPSPIPHSAFRIPNFPSPCAVPASPNSAFHISHFPSPFLRAPHHRNRRASAHPRSNVIPASPTPDSIYFARASDKRTVYK